MKSSPELRKLLDTCEALQQIRNKMTDPDIEREVRTRLRRQSKRKTDQLTRDLKTYHFRGPLAEVMESFPLAPDHFQILSVMLQRQMRCEDPALEGRLILASIFESAYDVLARVDLLHPESPLRASGLVVLENDEETPEDLLEARFVLSEEGLEGFRCEIAGAGRLQNDPRRPTRHDPYPSNRELLVDLRIIHNLHRLRSERIFNEDRWNRLHNSSYEPGRSIDTRIASCWERLKNRLDHTPKAATFPAVRMMREYSLGEEEMMIAVHLLFKELFEGSAYADVAELLQLVSRSEIELIANRRLIADGAPLRKSEILRIEPMLENRPLTGEAYLDDWVVNYLFGAATQNADIRPDERIDWHVYLAGMDDTKGFFQDLDAN
jgi:Winged helix domain, variant